MKKSLILIREKNKGNDSEKFYLFSENRDPENIEEENSIYLKKILIG